MYFDMEVKRQIYADSGPIAVESYTRDFYKSMKGQVAGTVLFAETLGDAFAQYNPSEDLIKALCREYYEESVKPFTEEVCAAGAQIMLEEIQSRLSELVGDEIIGDDKPWEDMYVCSACRPDKFSLHAVMGRLFVD